MGHTHDHARRLRPGRGTVRQHGFGVFLMMVLMAGLAASAAMFSFYRVDRVAIAADRKATDSMADVKAALLSYAVRRGDATGTARPGELPCPDTDNDGFENTPCTAAATLLGRVPWKTLGIPEPKDSSGETLWYAISGPFRDAVSNPVVGDRINSDTRGTITVLGADAATLTNNAVAVIIAPGPAIGTQNRGIIGTVQCTLTGLTVLHSWCANNYLETSGATNNAGSTSGPFIAGAASNGFNDRVSFITTAELMSQVEVRVAREIIAALQSHYAVRGFYPWADTWPYSGGISDSGQNRGRFPSDPNPGWGTGGVRALPAWLEANDWHNLFWYTVSRGYTEGGLCSTCSVNHVTVDGVQVQALIISPGPPSDGLARLTDTTRRDNITLYLEDATNRNGANSTTCKDTGETGDDGSAPGGTALQGQPICDIYVTPTSTSLDRDRIYKIP